MNNITENDMRVVEMQRNSRKNGYTLRVSRNAPYNAKIINPQGLAVICESTDHDNRLDAANDAWNKFLIIAKDFEIDIK